MPRLCCKLVLTATAVGLGPKAPFTGPRLRAIKLPPRQFPGLSRSIGSPMTSALAPPLPAAPPPSKAGSSFTALTRRIHELGLMRRRYGYYWAKLIGAVVVLAAWVVAFVWIGNSWWQLISAAVLGVLMTQIAFLGHDAAHRQIFRSGR